MAINLSPWREQLAVKQIRRHSFWLLLSIGLVFVMALGARYYLSYLTQCYQLRNLHLAQQIAEINVPNDTQTLATHYQMITQQIKLIQITQRNQTHFWQELALLQQQFPPEMQLTHLSWSGQTLNLQGTTHHSEQISLLIKLLEKSRLFSQVILDNIDKDNQGTTIHFVVHADHTQETA